jgi:hypothetical protein
MKNNKRAIRYKLKLAIFIMALFFSGCYEKENIVVKTDKAINTNDPLYQHITNDLGFQANDVKDIGSMYLVEGDILFNKTDYTQAENASGRVAQTTTTALVSRANNQRDIAVSIDANIPTSGEGNWRLQIQAAVVNWNRVSCSNIRFRLVGRTGGRIHITNDNGTLTDPEDPGDDYSLAAAELPSGGQPGKTVLINVSLTGLSENTKTVAIMHELGHAVGFRHTNWSAKGEKESPSGANLIPGTSDSDAYSIMNANVPASRTTFSTNDLIAITNLYPSLTENCKVPLYRYYSSSWTDHFYTTEFAELGKGGTRYGIEWIECRIYPIQVSGTVALYRYWSNGAKDHFYTTSFSNLGSGTMGFVLERIEGYVFGAPVAGTIPLYRYYNATTADHFYTVDFGELGNGAGGYILEGTAAYVFP